MANIITVIGNLGKDPVSEKNPSGNVLCKFPVADNHTYTNNQGQEVKTTTWFNVEVWGKQGEACQTYLKEGSKVTVIGRVENRPYTVKGVKDEHGKPIEKTWLALVAQRVEFSLPPSNGHKPAAVVEQEYPIASQPPADMDIPF